jgi:hypothetical protein
MMQEPNDLDDAVNDLKIALSDGYNYPPETVDYILKAITEKREREKRSNDR